MPNVLIRSCFHQRQPSQGTLRTYNVGMLWSTHHNQYTGTSSGFSASFLYPKLPIGHYSYAHTTSKHNPFFYYLIVRSPWMQLVANSVSRKYLCSCGIRSFLYPKDWTRKYITMMFAPSKKALACYSSSNIVLLGDFTWSIETTEPIRTCFETNCQRVWE